MGADLGHEEDLVAPTKECVAHPILALAVVVFPGVVKKVHAGVDGLFNNGNGFLARRGVAQAVAAHANDGNALLRTPERLARDLVGAGAAQLELARPFLGAEQGLGQGRAGAEEPGGLQEVAPVEAVTDRIIAVIVHDSISW